jgi:hypothetical protein
MVAAAVAGAAIAGGVASSTISSSASKSAANTQAQAAEDAAHLQNDQWNQTQANLKPYLDFGSSAINPLQAAMGYNSDWSVNPASILQEGFNVPTAADAAATPGYQFTLNQGLKSVQNSAAARGLGTSGAALKGASTYATGLADSTYNDVFNRALQTFQTNYNSAAQRVNRLTGIVGSGQNAASGLGALGAQTTGNIANTLTSGANASAAGTIGSANAISNGLNGIASNALTAGLLTNNAAGGGGGVVDPFANSTGQGTNGFAV